MDGNLGIESESKYRYCVNSTHLIIPAGQVLDHVDLLLISSSGRLFTIPLL